MKIKFNLGLKLTLPHIVGFLVVCVLFGVSFYSLWLIAEVPRLIVEELDELNLVVDLQNAVTQARMPLNDFLIVGADPDEKSNFVHLAQITDALFARLDIADINRSAERLYLNMAKEKFQRVKEIGNVLFSLQQALGNPVAGRLMEEADAVADEAIAELGKFREQASEEQKEALQKVSAIISKSKWIFYITLVVSLSYLMILIMLIPYFVSRPLRKLRLGADLIGKGNLSHRIKIKTGDELQELAEEFNRMAESLQGSYAGLEKKVAERTAGLELATKELSLKKYETERNNLELAREREALLNLSEDMRNMNARLKSAQEQLVQSAKMAAIGQLAGGVAHEINNPLTGVLNNVQLIKMELAGKKEYSPVDFKELLDVIEESGQRCKRIVATLLDFSRTGKGLQEPINLTDVIDKAVALANNEIKFENIKLIREYAPGLPKIKGDANQLQQVFLNMLNNAKWALQHTAQAELRLSAVLSSDGNSVVVRISDNGCGIEKKDLSRIFEPFFTTKKPGEGTGLGLSVSYGIIKDHNGVMEIESEGKGKGAAFRVILPAI